MAQNVLAGKTKGYKNHPQLVRFRNTENPESAISNYLGYVADEADKRNYKFNREKIRKAGKCRRIKVTEGQVKYELEHLLGKLKVRDPNRYKELRFLADIQSHPLFTKVDGGVEEWEVIHG